MKRGRFLMLRCTRSLLVFLLCVMGSPCLGLEPTEILVVANTEMKGSVELGRYYMEKRHIPATHLLSLPLSQDETMTRLEYEEVLADGVSQALDRLQPEHRIAAIVLIYGVPLKVAPPLPELEALDSIQKHRAERAAIKEQNGSGIPNAGEQKKELGEKIRALMNTNQRAAVDSELSLVKVKQYDLDGWIKNPYYLGFQGQDAAIGKDEVLLVCRLDGPDIRTVYRVIDDSLSVEGNGGLQGRAYFDARWPKAEGQKGLDGYSFYDNSLHLAAEIAGRTMDVVFDDSDGLFPEEACPNAAIYCGWYSLGNYIDSFAWQRGAVGYHIASSECSTLRRKESSVWCKKMLEKGVAATIGPVFEPYVQGFPVPHLFFTKLLEGYMSLGESYLVSLPYLSWQMVLVGDPLYQPFRPVQSPVGQIPGS